MGLMKCKTLQLLLIKRYNTYEQNVDNSISMYKYICSKYTMAKRTAMIIPPEKCQPHNGLFYQHLSELAHF